MSAGFRHNYDATTLWLWYSQFGPVDVVLISVDLCFDREVLPDSKCLELSNVSKSTKDKTNSKCRVSTKGLIWFDKMLAFFSFWSQFLMCDFLNAECRSDGSSNLFNTSLKCNCTVEWNTFLESLLSNHIICHIKIRHWKYFPSNNASEHVWGTFQFNLS